MTCQSQLNWLVGDSLKVHKGWMNYIQTITVHVHTVLLLTAEKHHHVNNITLCNCT